MEVWKSPSCGCCKEWIKHVESRGFRVTVHDIGNTAARERMKLPMKLGSCHTAVVGRYAVEGHVPAADVLRLIKEAPDAVGLAVPGMPVGSPGMDGPDYGDQRDPFDVLLVVMNVSDPWQLADLVATLEKRFGRKLNASVVVEPELIGGVRVVVGDEVLDTSVKARLDKMKLSLMS